MAEKNPLVEKHTLAYETFGIWDEMPIHTVLFAIMSIVNPTIVKEFEATEILKNGNKFLIKWEKRFIPLSEEQYKDKFKK